MRIPLTFELISLNRTMGREDLYPFIITLPVIEKLGFFTIWCACKQIKAGAGYTSASRPAGLARLVRGFRKESYQGREPKWFTPEDG